NPQVCQTWSHTCLFASLIRILQMEVRRSLERLLYFARMRDDLALQPGLGLFDMREPVSLDKPVGKPLKCLTQEMARSLFVVLHQDSGPPAKLQAQQDNLPGKGKAVDNDNIRIPFSYPAMKAKRQPLFSGNEP